MATLEALKSRFLAHPHRHPHTKWDDVEKRLIANPDTFATIEKMEETGGEPDVVEFGEDCRSYVEDVAKVVEVVEPYYVDCSLESPSGRRSLCFDKEAREGRKENPPKNSVEEMAKQIGITLLNEEEYRKLQSFDNFDTKTSTWIDTPKDIRSKGGALYGDRRYDRVFTYHNGADSYYAARGFRGKVKI